MKEIDNYKLLVKTLKRVDYRKPYTNISRLVVLSHVNQSISKHLSNHKLESKKAIIPVKILRKHTQFVIHSESKNIYLLKKSRVFVAAFKSQLITTKSLCDFPSSFKYLPNTFLKASFFIKYLLLPLLCQNHFYQFFLSAKLDHFP